jgi:hypothetical protein
MAQTTVYNYTAIISPSNAVNKKVDWSWIDRGSDTDDLNLGFLEELLELEKILETQVTDLELLGIAEFTPAADGGDNIDIKPTAPGYVKLLVAAQDSGNATGSLLIQIVEPDQLVEGITIDGDLVLVLDRGWNAA